MLYDEAQDGLPEHLQLEEDFEHVQLYLHAHDADLRLRRSAERAELYVLERRCRRAPAVNTGMGALSDIHVQARQGYIHVSTVHPEWLMHPWNILIALRDEGVDLWAAKNANAIVDEMEYEEAFVRESRRRRRRDDFKGQVRETFDILSRLGNKDGTERSRFTNPGLPAMATERSPA